MNRKVKLYVDLYPSETYLGKYKKHLPLTVGISFNWEDNNFSYPRFNKQGQHYKTIIGHHLFSFSIGIMYWGIGVHFYKPIDKL